MLLSSSILCFLELYFRSLLDFHRTLCVFWPHSLFFPSINTKEMGFVLLASCFCHVSSLSPTTNSLVGSLPLPIQTPLYSLIWLIHTSEYRYKWGFNVSLVSKLFRLTSEAVTHGDRSLTPSLLPINRTQVMWHGFIIFYRIPSV